MSGTSAFPFEKRADAALRAVDVLRSRLSGDALKTLKLHLLSALHTHEEKSPILESLLIAFDRFGIDCDVDQLASHAVAFIAEDVASTSVGPRIIGRSASESIKRPGRHTRDSVTEASRERMLGHFARAHAGGMVDIDEVRTRCWA